LLTKLLFHHRSVCKPRIVQTSNTQILNATSAWMPAAELCYALRAGGALRLNHDFRRTGEGSARLASLDRARPRAQ
jgi:hypothetical protein